MSEKPSSPNAVRAQNGMAPVEARTFTQPEVDR
ncbi:MAG: hypothetical protein JWM85_1831, partial [Acidimicrobiaceae bacterium]|nr:hypothetical protein [Acidimicrobiaceae bacterium]